MITTWRFYLLGWNASTTASISSLARSRTPGPLTFSIGVSSSMSSLVPCVSFSWVGDFSFWIFAFISSFPFSMKFVAFASSAYIFKKIQNKTVYEWYICIRTYTKLKFIVLIVAQWNLCYYFTLKIYIILINRLN